MEYGDMMQEVEDQVLSDAWLILQAKHLAERLEVLKHFERNAIQRRRLNRAHGRAEARHIRRQGGPFEPETEIDTTEEPF